VWAARHTCAGGTEERNGRVVWDMHANTVCPAEHTRELLLTVCVGFSVCYLFCKYTFAVGIYNNFSSFGYRDLLKCWPNSFVEELKKVTKTLRLNGITFEIRPLHLQNANTKRYGFWQFDGCLYHCLLSFLWI
jgi:hypothetical protein